MPSHASAQVTADCHGSVTTHFRGAGSCAINPHPPADGKPARGSGGGGGAYSSGSPVAEAAGRPRRGIGPAPPGNRPASASARRNRYSICALAERSSSPAHRASASWTSGSSRSRTCLRRCGRRRGADSSEGSVTGRGIPCSGRAAEPGHRTTPPTGSTPSPPSARGPAPRCPSPTASSFSVISSALPRSERPSASWLRTRVRPRSCPRRAAARPTRTTVRVRRC